MSICSQQENVGDQAVTLRKLDLAMKRTFAQRLCNIISQLASDTCFGCRIDHPSHDICTLPTDELVDVLFHAAVERVKAVDVMRDWLCIIEERNPPMLVSELDGRQSLPWLYDEWSDDAWIREMKQLIQSCLCDERHTIW